MLVQKPKFETKIIMVGEDGDLGKEARVLNRIVRWHPQKGIIYDVDRKHVEIIIRDIGAEKLKTISTPAAKETGRETEEEKRPDLNERRLSGKLGTRLTTTTIATC